MSHNHNHSCVCEHVNVKFCKHCHTVYCLDCSQEWTTKSTWAYGYWHYPSTLGNVLTKYADNTYDDRHTTTNTNPQNLTLTTACSHSHQG